MSQEEREERATLTERIQQLMERMDRFEEASFRVHVTKDEFEPVRKLVYGGAGVILTGVLISMLWLIGLHVHL